MFDKNQLIKLRKSLDLTQLEFARKIGTSRQVVGLWESGDTKPSLDLLENIGRECKVPIGYFFNGE
jgi:transcriptional regulator with XRE-family HTH domain